MEVTKRDCRDRRDSCTVWCRPAGARLFLNATHGFAVGWPVVAPLALGSSTRRRGVFPKHFRGFKGNAERSAWGERPDAAFEPARFSGSFDYATPCSVAALKM